MNLKSLFKNCRIVLMAFILIFSLSLFSCDDSDKNTESSSSITTSEETESTVSSQPLDSTQSVESSTQEDETSTQEDESSTQEPVDPIEPEPVYEYYEATLKSINGVTAFPYTGEVVVPDALSGIYYSSDSPGGNPKKDGKGKIWLVLKPEKNYSVSDIKIEGMYSSIENLGRDIYCIHDVESDLSISFSTKTLPSTSEQVFKDFGYGISEDGTMIVSWEENPEDPIRYVELKYMDGSKGHLEYIDASLGKAELFKMKENSYHTVMMRAIGYDHVGKTVQVKGYYMNGPRSVSFPRVEITTENYIWPSFDRIQSPDECWGAGITNAFYEQCIMTIYNEKNEVVYKSSSGMGNGREFLGAKMKVRGNTSAYHASNERFPYKIKLDSKYDLLEPLIGRPDDGKAYADKDWVLLNYGADDYRICGEAIADAVGTAWSPDYCYVALYLNGEYRGLYVLSESVKEGNGTGDEQWRVNVDSDGYVFECDAYWWNEDLYFSTPMTQNTPMYFTFKYPDADDFDETSEEYIYLRDYMIQFEEALKKDDDSYLDYIDLDSFVKWLLVSDYLCIEDGGGCNLFLYKKDSTENTKIFMGPNWDFDSYMGDVEALATIRLYWNGAPFYYPYIIAKKSFQTRYKELFNETRGKLNSFIDDEFSKIDEEAHLQLLEYDNIRFGTSVKSLSAQKAKFKAWLGEHLAWMEFVFE